MEDHVVAAKPPRRFSRLARWLAALLLLIAIGLASTPTLLSTPPARRMLVQAVNGSIHPGRIEVGGVSLSWSSGTVLKDVTLRDPQGKVVLTAGSVRSARGLIGLLRSGPDYGAIEVDGATVDVERREDGSIDVLEALGALMAPGDAPSEKAPTPTPSAAPSPSVTVVVKGTKARIASPELAEPIAASAFEAQATLAPGKPVDVVAKLVEGERSITLKAGYDAAAAPGLTLAIDAVDWPLAVRQPGLGVRGDLAGSLQAEQSQGRWSARGDAIVRRFVAEGPALKGDRLALDEVSAGCDVSQTPAGWSVRKLGLKSTIAELSAVGDLPVTDATPAKLTGHVDLAAATKLLPHAIPLREGVVVNAGRARIEAEASLREGSERLVASTDLADLAATEGGRPLTLNQPARLSAVVVRTGEKVAVESFAVKAAGIDASATGDLISGVKMSGTVDLAAVEAQARQLIDLGAVKLAGKGRMAADYRPAEGAFKARIAAEIDGLHVEGLAAEPIDRDRVRFDGSADGPRDARGLPTDWTAVKVGLTAGPTKGSLLAKVTEGGIVFVVEGMSPVTSPAPAVVAGKVALHRAGAVYALDDVHLSATPTAPEAASAAVAIVAKGEYDPNAGRLVLIPVGQQPSRGISVGPEGCMVTGLNKPDVPMGFDGVLAGDLSMLDRTLAYWTQSPLRGVGGAWTARTTLTRQLDGRVEFNGRVGSPNFFLSTPKGSVELTLNGAYTPAGDRLDLAAFDLSTSYGRLAGSGAVDQLAAACIADVTAVLEPNWQTLDPIVAASVEPQAQVRATVRPFHLRGSLAAGSASQILKGMDGALAVDVASARAFGMQLGATAIVLNMGGGRAAFDPIATTLNDGQVAIGADLIVDDPNALWLRLAQGTKIEGAAINKDVSDQVLSFIAPVLAEASDVSGKVSLTVDGATIPIVGDGSLRVDGQLVFQDVVYEPGPLANELVALTGRKPLRMSLQQPLQLQIADGRVRQSGLSIPINGDVTAKLEGSVGFDKTLAMRATVPITPQMLGGNAVAKDFVGGVEVPVPIGGTISHPVIDKSGLRVALRDAAKSMVRQGVRTQAGRLLDQVVPPAAGGRNNAGNARGGSLGRDALNVLEGMGRDLIQQQPQQPQQRRR